MMIKAMILAFLIGPNDKAAEEALARFRASYRSPSAPARATAVADLARVQHKKTLVALAPLLQGDVTTVRIAAAKGLGGFLDYKRMAVPILMGSLKGRNSKEYDVQAEIYTSLGKLGAESALPMIRRAFKAKNPKVAGAAYKAAGKMKAIYSIDEIVKNMEKEEKLSKRSGTNDPQKDRAKKLLPDIIKAMQLMSGDKWTTAQEWQIWWKRKRTKILLEAARRGKK